jgi:hypothetical protein
MNGYRVPRWVYCVIGTILLCFQAGGIAQGSRVPGFVEPVSPTAAGISFQQVSFEFDAGRVPDSDWGQMQVDPVRWSAVTGLTSGYINLFLYPGPSAPEGGWVIRNLLVPWSLTSLCSPEDAGPPGGAGRPGDHLRPQPPLSIYFDLRPTREGCGRVEAILVVILVSRQPLPETREMIRTAGQFPRLWVAVERFRVNAEGDLGEDDRSGPPPAFSADLVGLPPTVPPFPTAPTDLSFPITVFQADFPNAHAAKNQCVPMAHANVLQYLENRYNALPLLWLLPHPHIPGIGKVITVSDVLFWEPEPPESLVANIDAFTRRTGVVDFSTGGGTGRCRQIRGLFGYFAVYGAWAKVEYRHQGGAQFYGEGETCDDGTFPGMGGIVSSREGVHPTWEWMFEQLQLGRGLAISYGRYDAEGNRTGGHMLRVWGAARYNNRNYIYTLDDADQGPNMVGLRTKQWEVADTGSPGAPGVPDGRLNLDGTSWEVEFAISAEAKPTFLPF